jgi:SAM-dependent methyltransferase
VTGLDFSRRQLELAAERVPGAWLVAGDLTALPFADGAFDALYSLNAVIHVPRERHRGCFAEFRRVLRTDAPLLATVGHDDWVGTNDDWMGLGAEMHWEIPGLERATEPPLGRRVRRPGPRGRRRRRQRGGRREAVRPRASGLVTARRRRTRGTARRSRR